MSNNSTNARATQPLTQRAYLWQLLRYKPWLWLLTILAYMVLYGLNFAPPLIVRTMFDRLTITTPEERGATFGLWTLIVLYVCAAVGRQAAYVGLITGQTWYTYLVGSLVRVNLFEQILQRPAAQPLPSSAGEALSRFRDDIQATTTFLSSLFNLIGLSVFVILAVVTMVRTSPLLTVVAFLPLLLVNLLIQQSSQRIIRFRTANQVATGQVTGLLGEIFGAVQAVKLADAEGAVIAHFAKINEARRQAALKDRLVTEVMSALGGNLGDIGAAVILLLMAQALRIGSFTIGDFVLFTYVMPFVAGNVGSVAGVLTSYRQLGVSLQRLSALLEAVPATTAVQHRPIYLREPLPPLPAVVRTERDQLTLLTVRDLSYRYPDSKRGIANVSFQLPRGSFTVITGRVGAGKSTLLRVLLGLLPRERGELRWNGEIIADAGAFFQPPRCAYLPQTPRLFSDALRENILMGVTVPVTDGLALPTQTGVEPSTPLAQALWRAVFAEEVAHFAAGLETPVGPRGVRLSGGQLQRAAVARMLVRNPALLVFDDLSSALDVETEAKLWSRLLPPQGADADNLLQQSFLAVSHRRNALARADQIIVLKDGVVTGLGTLAELLADNAELQHLWQHQAS